MRKILISIFVVALTLTLGACGNKKDNDDQQGQEQEPEPSEEQTFAIDEDEMVENEKVVATVNGKELVGDIYNFVYTETKIQLYNYGQDISDKEKVKELVLNALVEQELITQDAKERGIDVSEEEIDTEFDSLFEENDEELQSFLDEYQLQEKAFKEQLTFSLIFEKYIDSAVSADITDEEVEEMYDELKSENEEMPELDEIKENLREQMVMQKEQELLRDIVDDLKEQATIDMKI